MSNDDCRKAFEEWAHKEGLYLTRNPSQCDLYDRVHHNDYWRDWQAAWNIRSPERESLEHILQEAWKFFNAEIDDVPLLRQYMEKQGRQSSDD